MKHGFANVTGDNADVEFDFGLHFKTDGTGTYQIIRDSVEDKQCLGMNGTPGGNRLVDQFTFVFSRSSQPESNGSTGYVCYLLQGYDPESGNGQYENFIVARKEMEGDLGNNSEIAGASMYSSRTTR